MNSVLDLAEKLAQPSRILIVDDDKHLCEILTRSFTRIGCEAKCVHTGAETTKLLMQKPQFDALLLDIQLPDMQGNDILALMKRIKLDIPVIVMTGYPSAAVDALLDAYGVIVILTKPMSQFVSVISRYLRILNIRHISCAQEPPEPPKSNA